MSDSYIPDTAPDDTATQSGDELEHLLAQFDADTARPADTSAAPQDALAEGSEAPQPDGMTLDEILIRSERATLNAARDQFEHEYRQTTLQFQKAAHERDLPVAIKEIRGELDNKKFTDEFVDTWLSLKARGSDALQQAWLNRAQDPATWRAAQRQLTKEFNATFKLVDFDEAATEDHNAVAAAVRGSTSNMPHEPPVRYGQLSNADFAKDVKEKYGFDAGV